MLMWSFVCFTKATNCCHETYSMGLPGPASSVEDAFDSALRILRREHLSSKIGKSQFMSVLIFENKPLHMQPTKSEKEE